MLDPTENGLDAAGSSRAGSLLKFDATRFVLVPICFCIVCEIALLFLDYFINYGGGARGHFWSSYSGMRRLFNIAHEKSLANWFGTAQTMMVALTAWFMFFLARSRVDLRPERLGWLILALFFSWMTADDGAVMHERLGTFCGKLFQEAREDDLLPGWLEWWRDTFGSYNWQFFFLPIFGVLGLFMLVFLIRRLKGKYRVALVIMGIMLMVVAVGLDYLEGYYEHDYDWNPYEILADELEEKYPSHKDMKKLGEEYPGFEKWLNLRYRKTGDEVLVHISRAWEETIEMLAMTILWFLLLRHLVLVSGEMTIRFEHRHREGADPDTLTP